MDNPNLTKILLLIITLLIITGFFLMNNVMHTGFHIGHAHSDGYMGMVGNHDHDDIGSHTDETKDYEISPSEVVQKIQNNEDIILLDVRTPEEYAEIHLKNSLLLPVGKLSANTLMDIGLGEESKNKEIIIYCRSGSRSKQAHDVMSSLGYTNIKSISGGLVHWQEENYPFTEAGE